MLVDLVERAWRRFDARNRTWERAQWQAFAAWLLVVTWKRLAVVAVGMLIVGGMVSSCLDSLQRDENADAIQINKAKSSANAKNKPQTKISLGSDGVTVTDSITGKTVRFSLDGLQIDSTDTQNKSAETVASNAEGVVVTDSATGKRLILGDRGIRQEDIVKPDSTASRAASGALPAKPEPPAPAEPPKPPTAPSSHALPQHEATASPAQTNDLTITVGGQTIKITPGQNGSELAAIIEEIKAGIEAEKEAARDRAEAQAEARAEAAESGTTPAARNTKRRASSLNQMVMPLTGLLIALMLLIKIILNTRSKAEAKVAVAQEATEREALQRQLVEARLTTLQAQVEPHFLFNSLASVEHLIQVAPERAAQMQRHLIDYLRAAMPHMRESASNMGREAALMSSYLEILKFRMEERLEFTVLVPSGLHSAEVPPMMLLSLVENCIKHGLEPKPQGGRVDVLAEISHGKLRVSVADTGMGFTPENSPTRGTRVGLQNIRERLGMLYGHTATFTIGPNVLNPAGGTLAVLELPYKVANATA